MLVAVVAVPTYLYSNTPSPSPSSTPTTTASPTPSPIVTASPTPLATSLPSSTPIVTASPSPTPTPTATTQTIVDHLGRTVQVPTHPTRIVSCHAIATQVILALGGASQLIAVDQANTKASKVVQMIYPAIGDLTGITGDVNQPSVETIVALHPDLVIVAAYYPSAAQSLAAAGLTVVAFNFHSRPPVDTIDLIGRAIGKQDGANKLIDYYNQKISAITIQTENMTASDKPSVMYASSSSTAGGQIVWTVAGNQAFQNSLIVQAGGRNIGENLTGIWLTESPEQILQWNPQYIIAPAAISGFDSGTVSSVGNAVKADPVINQTYAIQNHHLIIMPRLEFSTATDCLESIIGLEIIAKTLHPTTFANLNLNADVKELFSTFYNTALTDDQVNQLLNPGT